MGRENQPVGLAMERPGGGFAVTASATDRWSEWSDWRYLHDTGYSLQATMLRKGKRNVMYQRLIWMNR